jgi:hypothetical protein
VADASALVFVGQHGLCAPAARCNGFAVLSLVLGCSRFRDVGTVSVFVFPFHVPLPLPRWEPAQSGS